MSSNLEQLRKSYRTLHKKAQNNQMKTVKWEQIKELQKMAQDQLDRVTKENEFENLEQIDFYREKFKSIRQAHINGAKNKKTWKQLNIQMRDLLAQGKYTHQSNIKPVQSKIYHPQSQVSPRLLLSSFFVEKKAQIGEQATFKSLLESPQVSNKSFRKKIMGNNEEIQDLRRSNFDLKRKLESILPKEKGIQYNQQLRRIQERLRQLQDQNNSLYKENNKLKTQYPSSTGSSQNTVLSLEQMLTAPYFLFTRQNDLQKINARNSEYDQLSGYNPRGMQHDSKMNRLISFQNEKGEALSEIKENKNDVDDTFSLYQYSKSFYSSAGGNDSYHLGIENKSTAHKNKKAFFKDSGIIVRDQTVDIAFKKIDQRMLAENKVKFYIYLNSKVNSEQNVEIIYDYETSYFQFNTIKKVTKLEPFKQARESIEIRLKEDKGDINSHSTAIIRINDKVYKIWIPVLFVQLQAYSTNSTAAFRQDNEKTKIILPAKIFKTPEESQKVISILEIQNNTGILWGQSRNYEGPITLTWKKDNQLQIKTNKAWMDALSFVFLEFQ